MQERTELTNEYELKKFKLHQKVIANLCAQLDIPDIRAGKLTIRDERNWRVNEKEISYCWLVNISRSFVGWCWICYVKFNESNFRDVENPEELIKVLCTTDQAGNIDKLHIDTKSQNFEDKIRDITAYDMFDANLGFTLDGVTYEFIVFAPNTELRITLNNPNSENWKKWEKEIWKIGGNLAEESGIDELKEIFS